MKVLVTGGAGFIGSILISDLLKEYHQVRLMDIFNFGFDPIKDIVPNKSLEIYPGDIRKMEDVNKALDGVDAVIHLAAIVGDPACAVQADNAVETNYLSTLRLARASRDAGVDRFIFASTCSVYGACEGVLDESSELNPQSLYGETKILAERGIMDLSNDKFEPIILRLGTLYGLSNRPRFDLVVNYLTGKIMAEGSALIFGGEQWRPFLHVRDAARGFHFGLKKYDQMKGGIFNLGSTGENYQMKEIGKIFESIFPEASVQYVDKMKDPRSYNVSFKKIEDVGFKLSDQLIPSIEEIRDWINDENVEYHEGRYYNYRP